MPRLRPSDSSAYTPSPMPGARGTSTTAPSARPTPAPTPGGSSTNVAIPDYEPPTFELTPNAREKISLLLNQYPAQALNIHLKDAADGLIHHVEVINSHYMDTENKRDRQRSDRTEEGENGEEEAPQTDQLQEKVTGMTGRMESAIKKCIDAQAGVEAVNKALRETQGNAQKAGNTQATQATAVVTQDGQENTADDEPHPEPLTGTFDDAFEKHTGAYLGKAPKLRYKEHDWFRNFKTAAYYSAQGDNSRPMNPDTWFDEGGPRPGETARVGDDDDFEEMGERISTKCPITLQEFKEPVTSKKCPHSFERSAFLDMLSHMRPPTRGRNSGWVQDIECPVPGCASRLTKDDLEEDIRLKTLIKRKQRREELARQEAEEEGEGHRRQGRGGAVVEEIESGSEDDIDRVERSQAAESSVAKSIKRERMRRATQDAIEEMDEE